jgi:hypothetical protein
MVIIPQYDSASQLGVKRKTTRGQMGKKSWLPGDWRANLIQQQSARPLPALLCLLVFLSLACLSNKGVGVKEIRGGRVVVVDIIGLRREAYLAPCRCCVHETINDIGSV